MHRIAALPRRNWQDLIPESRSVLEEHLKMPGSGAALRGMQAVALREIFELGGGAVIADVGMGKTLITLLVGELLGEERVLILVPNGAKRKTEQEFRQYRLDWRGVHGNKYKLLGYHDVSGFPRKGFSLQRLWQGKGPTLIVCDEADRLRRVHASEGASGLAMQVHDYLRANPHCKLIALTATPDKSGVKDYAHILEWCLRERSPLPLGSETNDLEDWSSVIDKGDPRFAHKVCAQLGIPPTEDVPTIRAAYNERLKSTPGVVVTDEGFSGPLNFECHVVEPPPNMVPHFTRLYEFNQRPDGLDLNPEGAEQDPDLVDEGGAWACERQLALGFCYVADPPAPEEWLEARRNWFRVVRRCLSQREYYTPLQVQQAAVLGQLRPAQQQAYVDWCKTQPTFTLNSVTRWLSDHMLEICKAWGQEPGIIWVDHIAFGLKLEAYSGFRYFRGGGLDRRGRSIEKASPRECVIAARGANGQGRNLQGLWHRNLITALPSNNRDFQQMVGRTHRSGQKHPVTVDVLLAARAHLSSLDSLLDSAQRQSESIMQQKATAFPWRIPEIPTRLRKKNGARSKQTEYPFS